MRSRTDRWWRRALLLPVLLLAGAACDDGAPPPDAQVADVEEAEAYDGLTPEQIRAAAEPMSPDRAEALGIVDTTIHIENPTLDTLAVPQDTAGVPGAER